MNENMTFAHRLRIEREKLNLRQKEMATKLGLPANTYNGYETGKRSPSLEVAKQISDALNVSVDYLLGRTNIKNSTPSTPPNNLTDGQKNLLAGYDQLSPKDQKEIEKLIEFKLISQDEDTPSISSTLTEKNKRPS